MKTCTSRLGPSVTGALREAQQKAERRRAEEAAARLGVPIATLRAWLSRLRQRYRNLLRMEVASTVSDPADVDEELRYLHRILMA